MSRGDGGLFKESRLDLFAAITGLLAIIWTDRISETIAPWALPVTLVLGVVYVGGRVVVSARRRRAERAALDAEEREPRLLPLTPPPWHRPDALFGREPEVRRALGWVRESGFAVVAGPRDIGTSAVAATVVQRLIDQDLGGDLRRAHRFDLRSRSTTSPDDATTTAGRIAAAFGVDEPSDDTERVLARTARRVLAALAGNAVLMLDNVSTPEQVAWLVQQWPADGPKLVVAGETAVLKVTDDRALELGELDLLSLRQIWDAELYSPEPGVRAWLRERLGRRSDSAEDGVDELLRACLGRPGAVKALAQEIRRPGSSVTLASLLDELRRIPPSDGVLVRVWSAILGNIRAGLSEPAWRLLAALTELPVTGLTVGAVAAVLGAEDREPLAELRVRNLVREHGGRYRLPQEVRQAMVATSDDGPRRTARLRAVPAVVRYLAEHVETWVVRLDTDSDGARAWFRESEPSLRPLFNPEHLTDLDLLRAVLGDLCAIADALERWYVREQQSRGLLEVNGNLYELVLKVRAAHLAALAKIRVATAHRLAGRLGAAVEALDLAHSYADTVADEQVRAELHLREQVERALLAMAGVGPDDDGVRAAVAALDPLRATRDPAVLVNLGALTLGRGRFAEALDLLREGERAAADSLDDGAYAHSVELQGVALSQLGGRMIDAVRCWQRALDTFARIGENRGEARCLQHLGSAALTYPSVASYLRNAGKAALDDRAVAAVALPLLERAKELRAGQPDTEIVDRYLRAARELRRDR